MSRRWRFPILLEFLFLQAWNAASFILCTRHHSLACHSHVASTTRGDGSGGAMKMQMVVDKTKSSLASSAPASNSSKETKRRGNKHQRASKNEMNELIKTMGLTPVGASSSKSRLSQPTEERPVKKKKKSQPWHAEQHPSIKTQLQYSRNGHAFLRGALPPSTVADLRADLIQYSQQKELEAWRQKVQVATNLPSTTVAQKCRNVSQCQQILLKRQHNPKSNAKHDMLQIPFLQHFNTWRDLTSVHRFVTSPPLTSMARTLLDVPCIKLYQDSLFHKRRGDGPTPWHSDARMAPFDTSHMITFWIPLDDVPSVEEGGTGLFFVDKSHADFALPFWNRTPAGDVGVGDDYEVGGRVKFVESQEYERLDVRYSYAYHERGNCGVKEYMPMNVGDCTIHAGWTLHGSNSCDEAVSLNDRYALAVTYVDAKAEIREDVVVAAANKSRQQSLAHEEDRKSYESWVGDVEPRTYFEHPLVPIV